MMVTLEGFAKEIKRKIAVNNNISLIDFSRGVILSMNGDLSHCYGIKKDGIFLSDVVFNGANLSFLDLSEK